MQPRPISLDDTEDHQEEQQHKGSDRTTTCPPLPPPRDIYTALAGTLAQPMDTEQYYQHVLQELPATHATLQGWRQEKEGDNEWGQENDILPEDNYGTMDTFPEAAASTYPRPPGDTRHGLHALVAFHSSKHHHTISLHPLQQNPQRWTPEDNATTTITI